MIKYRQHLLAVALIFAAGLLSYFDSLPHPYMIDDHPCFEATDKSLSSMPHRFFSENQDVYYRPLAYILPSLSYLIFGNNVVGHHALNLFLFCLAGFLIYLFIVGVRFIGPSFIKGAINRAPTNETLGILTALLYVVHPINGVVVNYITASVFAAEVIFMVAALLFLCRGSIHRTRMMFSVLFFILALMCHETAAMLPFYAVALLVFGLGQRWVDALRRTMPLWVVLGVFIWFHWSHASIDENLLSKFGAFHMTLPQYAASLVKLLWWYLGRLLYPNGIVLIWTTPVVYQAIGWWILLLIGLAGIFAFLMRHFKEDRVIRLGLVWLALGFLPLPLGSMFQPAHGLMIEPHWFIFSGIGFFLIIARIFVGVRFIGPSSIKGAINSTPTTSVLILIVLIAWMSVTHIYNSIWADEKRYCFYWIKQAPSYSAALFFLGEIYKYDHEYVQARYFFNRALYREYDQGIIYMNLGDIDLAEQKWAKARHDYTASLFQYGRAVGTPEDALAFNNLGLLAIKNNDDKKAMGYFHQAIATDPKATLPRLNIVQLQLKHNDSNGAIDTLQEILRLDPHHEIARISLLKIYVDRHDESDALAVLDHLMASRSAQTLTNAGILWAFYKKYAQAETAFTRSVQLDPYYMPAYAQATTMFAQLGKFDRAFMFCQKGLAVNPQDSVLNDLINRLRTINGT